MLGLAMGLGNTAKEALMELEKKYRQKMTNLRKAAKKRVEDDPAKEKDQDIKEPLMNVGHGKKGQAILSPLEQKFEEAGVNAVALMKKQFMNVMIRRTGESKNYLGGPLNGLPPCKEIHWIQPFSEAEQKVWDEIVEEVSNSM